MTHGSLVERRDQVEIFEIPMLRAKLTASASLTSLRTKSPGRLFERFPDTSSHISGSISTQRVEVNFFSNGCLTRRDATIFMAEPGQIYTLFGVEHGKL